MMPKKNRSVSALDNKVKVNVSIGVTFNLQRERQLTLIVDGDIKYFHGISVDSITKFCISDS